VPVSARRNAESSSAGNALGKTGSAGVRNAVKETPPSLSNQSRLHSLPQALRTDNSAETSAGKVILPREQLLKQTAAALGLPVDTLSITLLAFSRLFSFNLSPAFLSALRRDFLAQGKSSSPESAGDKAALEANVLGLIAALDKGVTLSPEALEQYARFLLPPAITGKTDTKEEDDCPPKEGTAVPAAKGSAKGSSTDREAAPGEIEVQAIAEEQAKKHTLLDFLNSLPGKNGQFWTVFPLKINVRGTELQVFIRILKREIFSAVESEYVIADIAGPKRQWRCFLGKKAGKIRADIRVFPEMSPRALAVLAKEAKRFLEGAAGNSPGFEEIQVRNGEEAPSWMEDLAAECLPSIDKEI